MTPSAPPTASRKAPAKRGRDIDEPHRVSTPLELLFDLVFVVAISLAVSQFHHGVATHGLVEVLPIFGFSFFGIWWAWMNYTWFASAYDNDDVWFRLLTMLQMVGALIFAVSIPRMFQGQFLNVVIGFAVMRTALVAQWLRVGLSDPAHRSTCLRYALGIALAQIGWIGRLWVPTAWLWPSVGLMIAVELAVPMWAEHAGKTPWHAHHIAERYSLMTIIILGECVLGTANALANVLQSDGWSWELACVGLGGLGLVLALWWMYFLLPSGQALHHHRERAWGWGYGHFFVYAALSCLGTGLEIVADALKTSPHVADSAAHAVSPVFSIAFLAGALGLFMFTVWLQWAYITRANSRQWGLLLMCLACLAGVVFAVHLGVPVALGLPLLCIAPVVAIIYNEQGRKYCADDFVVR